MNRKDLFKKLIAGVAVIAMVASCVVAMPETADAADSDKVIYENISNISTYRSGSYTAPTKPGYFFGGWYDAENGTALTEDEANKASSAYAKFVPSYVLSAKVQNKANTTSGDGATSIRMVSAVDSWDYQKVGFKVLLNNDETKQVLNEDGSALETTKGYTGLLVSGKTDPVTADQLFGAAAEYLMVWRLDDIADSNDAKIINITPYWITADGTKVEGLTKYAHVEDGYKGLVNVPINLCDDAVQMAAGLLEMTYDSDNLELYGVEYGLFDSDKMAYSDKGGSIKFVGNVEVADGDIAANGIYVNVRFSVKETVAEGVTKWQGTGVGDFLTFDVTGEQFCDWDEELVDVDAWNIQY